MKRIRLLNNVFATVPFALMTALMPAMGIGSAHAADTAVSKDKFYVEHTKVPPSEQKAAAARAKALGLKPGVAGKASAAKPRGAAGLLAVAPLPLPDGPGGTPHYFGPYGNWAYSPLPRGPVALFTVDSGGSGYTAPVVTIDDVYGTGSGATASATVANGVITAIVVVTPGTGYSAPLVTITDATGGGAAATASIGPLGSLTGGIRKFVDGMPGLTPAGANARGQYIPLAVTDTTYPGSDYYEIALVEYTEQMHTDLLPTRLRGYVQLKSATVPGSVTLTNPGDGSPILMPERFDYCPVCRPSSFSGPAIVAKSDKPVRVKFYNLLPKGAGR